MNLARNWYNIMNIYESDFISDEATYEKWTE